MWLHTHTIGFRIILKLILHNSSLFYLYIYVEYVMFTSIVKNIRHITARRDQTSPAGPHKIISLFKLAKSGVTILAAKRSCLNSRICIFLFFFFFLLCRCSGAFDISVIVPRTTARIEKLTHQRAPIVFYTKYSTMT